MKNQKSNNDYTWLDEVNFNNAKAAVNFIVEKATENGGEWKREWFDKLDRNGLEDIRKEVFEQVCKDLGFEPVVRPVVGVGPNLDITNDEAVIARVEVKKRMLPIDRTYNALNGFYEFPLTGWLITNSIARHLSEAISVDEKGAPYLVDDYEAKLQALCTHQIPEEWRGLCDIVRDNAQTLHELTGELNKLHCFAIPSYLLCVKESSEFSNSRFAKYLGL